MMLGGQELCKKFLMDKSKRHFDMDIDIDKLREEQEGRR